MSVSQLFSFSSVVRNHVAKLYLASCAEGVSDDVARLVHVSLGKDLVVSLNGVMKERYH